MSDDDQEIRAGNEAAQGYEPMVSADPVPSGDDLPTDAIMGEKELGHFKRPVEADWGHEVERDYFHNQTGEETPANQTVTAEQAAHDLRVAREAEAKALENEAREALAAALDGTDQPQAEQPEQPQLEVQPEADPAYAQGQNDEVEKLLQNPALRERVATELQQHATVAEYARAHYAQAAATLGQQVNALALAQFPELQGVAGNPDATAGALQVLARENPARFAELKEFSDRAAAITQHAQQVQAEQQQAMQQRQREEFARYAQAEDAKAFANVPAEELTQIRNYLYEEGKKAGFSREQINQHWGNNVALRNSHVSELIADGVRYRMAKAGITSHRANPIQKVQRPGVSESGPSDNDSYSSLERSFRGRDLTLAQAADLLSAKRARG